eukprot:scaffold7023_cov67-Skeletonema_dohrnii-CCMP3373.AAC.1
MTPGQLKHLQPVTSSLERRWPRLTNSEHGLRARKWSYTRILQIGSGAFYSDYSLMPRQLYDVGLRLQPDDETEASIAERPNGAARLVSVGAVAGAAIMSTLVSMW